MAQSSPQSSTADEAFAGVFADPVHGSQATFRAIMNAMAHPGSVYQLPDLTGTVAGVKAMMAAVAATLCDFDTPVFLDEPIEASDFAKWLAFNTGAPVTKNRQEAAFAFMSDLMPLTDMSRFSLGIQTYPDRSTTVVVEVPTLSEVSQVSLSGPGINGSAELTIGPLSRGLLEDLQSNHGLFPRGLDFIFVTDGALVCLPRSTVLSQSNVDEAA